MYISDFFYILRINGMVQFCKLTYRTTLVLVLDFKQVLCSVSAGP